MTEIARRVRRGEASVASLVERALDRLERGGRALGALAWLDREHALAEAQAVQGRVDAGEVLPLAGLPVAVKDNICTRGVPTTCASRMLEGFTPPYDATVMDRLREAGAVLVAKTNMDEFGMGSSNENSALGACRNPWDPARTPGGSSGGSAAAVAALLVPAALGSDTGGSIRQPAAFCGVVGLKPTYGRVSRYGLVAFGSSLDQVGPMAREVRDVAALLAVLAGSDARDATSSREPVDDYLAEIEGGVRGLRVGLPREYLDDAVDAAVAGSVRAAALRLEEAGARLLDVSLPHTRYAIPAYYVIATSEASSNLARFDGVHYGRRARDAGDIDAVFARSRGEGFGKEVQRRIMLGTFSLSHGYAEEYYDRAMRTRTLLRRDFDCAFESADVLLSPTTPAPPFRLGEKIDDPLQMYLTDALTVAGSLAGLPGLVVPSEAIRVEGRLLPVGVQLLGPLFSEARLLRVGRQVEKDRPGGAMLPPLTGEEP